MDNPFSISFGRICKNVIERDQEIQPILQDFNTEPTRNTVYILTGPRGCGKTVTLSHILDEYRKKNNWIVARLSQSKNMLEQLAGTLYENSLNKLKSFKVEFSFSFQGLTLAIKGDKPVSTIHTYLEKLLHYYKKKNIHVLVAIDDVVKDEGMVDFIRAYQGFLMDHYDMRLLMTGLYKNIAKLELDRSLTFLIKAPKLLLPPLSLVSIAKQYKETFNIEENIANSLAKLTKGYALAYQILGDILFRNKEYKLSEKVLNEFDEKLNNWSYGLIYEEMSEKEKEIIKAIAEGYTTNQELMDKLKMSKGNLAIYKKKLTDEGLISAKTRGQVEFSLPRFDKFVQLRKELYED